MSSSGGRVVVRRRIGSAGNGPATARQRRLARSPRWLREQALERAVGAAELVEADHELDAVREPHDEPIAADLAKHRDRRALGERVERRARAGHDEAAGAL